MPPLTTRPLYGYVIAVLIVWMLILIGMRLWAPDRFRTFAIFCAGFFIGMLAMYIAVHIYRWH